MDNNKTAGSADKGGAEEKVVTAEVWGDYVNFKELLYSLAICTAGALGGYIIAPDTPPKPLFFGLAGVLIGFIICTIVFKPKRNLIYEEGND